MRCHEIDHKGAEIDARMPAGATALMVAVENHRIDVIKLLLNKGADVKPKTTNGWTALGIAKQLRMAEVVQSLEQAGAKD